MASIKCVKQSRIEHTKLKHDDQYHCMHKSQMETLNFTVAI